MMPIDQVLEDLETLRLRVEQSAYINAIVDQVKRHVVEAQSEIEFLRHELKKAVAR